MVFLKLKKLKFKYILILLISLLVIPNNDLKSKENNEKVINNKSLNIDYLDKTKVDSYLLGPGDTLEIIWLRGVTDNLTRQTINADGKLNLPKIKSVYVEKLTIDELTMLLNKKYSQFIINPEVEINIIKYRPISFYIIGEVENPGFYTIPGAYSANISGIENSNFLKSGDADLGLSDVTSEENYFPTVFDSLRIAGGISEYSDLSKLEIVRENSISNGGGLIKTSISLIDMIDKGDTTQNIRILDGDRIKVNKSNSIVFNQLAKAARNNLNPKFIKVFVTGRVNSPGEVILSKSSTLNDAIELAGGPKVIKGPIKFIRYNSDGTIDSRFFAYSKNSPRGSVKNPLLKSGDIISINRNVVNVATEVLGELTQPFIGIFAAREVLEEF